MVQRRSPTLDASEQNPQHVSTAAQVTEDPSLVLGARLKHGRLVLGLTMKQLATAAGCSESMLSKVERGLATPSLSALHRLAVALNTNVAELTSVGPLVSSPITRHGKRPIISFKGRNSDGGINLERVIVPGPGRLLQSDIHVIEPSAQSDEQISHAGEELGFVLEGKLELYLNEERYLLGKGDSFYFPSDIPHGYRNPGKTTTRVLWINTPPTF